MNDTLAATPSIEPDLSGATHLTCGTVGGLGRPPERGAGDHEITNTHTRWAEVALKVLEKAAIIQDFGFRLYWQARPMPGHGIMWAAIDPSDTSCNSTERLHSDSDSAQDFGVGHLGRPPEHEDAIVQMKGKSGNHRLHR